MMMIIAPQVVALIARGRGIGEEEATALFMRSTTYELLEDESTKLWHLSPRALHMMFEEESSTGRITFPEGV